MAAQEKKEEKPLRKGYTTGACATAAVQAALTSLLSGEKQETATIYLPAKVFATFTVEQCEVYEGRAVAAIKKDAGDDPDVTHGAIIYAEVILTKEPGIELDGGEGVGRATKPGLAVEVGQAAINPVPRKMILSEAEKILTDFQCQKGVKIIISVPGGEEMAKKTLNGRLGILGGISILGTRGIVMPFSTAAYKASIIQAIHVARAGGCDHVAVTTGGRSEKYAMKQLPHLKEEAFIEMGDFIGFTLKHCKRLGIKKVSMVGMMGKFSKVAQGVMMVHSKSAPVDFNFLAETARLAGASPEEVEEVKGANTASHAGEMMAAAGHQQFFDILCGSCCEHAIKEVDGGLEVDTTLYTFKGECLGKAERHG
ncbi:cobalt-precorrin-5B (C(1))-methyltransferase [Bacillus aerolatus]|uniref:Cobalt-precorrin-5B C(1)-methyltransferase n=1 Tax=Bacillus aerolatus TaxID=2653354 RepID=A0A6I1FP79_9BACI|nr:cobalt-precorrin-5B (C(1))-methyltransferase [Bacillus aerolatus]KAB7709127.1 cobalt-precorrin-5B (C(1))-methyltransferase [Bacillus aerolatus]